ncbi:MAG: NYN domain-containing protein [Nitrospira sp.]|nr:NYN domain-containing protein [Nitrospira sp.]
MNASTEDHLAAHGGEDTMERVFIYWDNSNIFLEAQRLAEERNEGPASRYRIRINFDNLLRLAHANRPVERAFAAGSVPPEMRHLWNRMESNGIQVQLFDRGNPGSREQEVPDKFLQLRMLEDALDYNGTPGIVVLLTGDGAGYLEGSGFHSTLERMHNRKWRVEILSWAHSCNQRMRRWAEENGVFIALDDFYESITFMEPSRPGFEFAPARDSLEPDLSRRQTT